jgi:hypothetical protein
VKAIRGFLFAVFATAPPFGTRVDIIPIIGLVKRLRSSDICPITAPEAAALGNETAAAGRTPNDLNTY